MAFPHIGPFELIIVLVVILVVFGVGRLPEVGGALGRGIREFRRAQEGDSEPQPGDATSTDEEKSP